jgi:hypothetical protein
MLLMKDGMFVSNYVSSSNTLKFDDVVGVILSKEMQRKSIGETLDNVLTMENMGIQKDRGKGSGNCGNSRKGRSKSILGKIECWNCGKKEHLKKDCRDPKKQRGGQHEKNQEANVIGDVLQDDLIIYLDNITESWVVDSGSSFHATPHNNYFQCYVQGDFGQVHLGDDVPCKIVGMVWFPTGKRELKNKWVYRLKEEDGGKTWYKDRLVVKAFEQKKGIYFNEIFFLVVKMN